MSFSNRSIGEEGYRKCQRGRRRIIRFVANFDVQSLSHLEAQVVWQRTLCLVKLYMDRARVKVCCAREGDIPVAA